MNRVDIAVDGIDTTLEILGAYVIDKMIYLIMKDNAGNPYAYRVLPSGLKREATLDSHLANMHIAEISNLKMALAPKRPIELHLHIGDSMEPEKLKVMLDAIR